ncbi:MAG: response regulator transcription factor [Methylococcaceae bacterium]
MTDLDSSTDTNISTKAITVLLADDHPLVQDGIRTRFEEIEDISVIGVANDGKELLNKAEALQPDIIIADISMPYINGLEATRLLSISHPDIKVLILTMHDNREYMQNALDSGAKGYILKDQPANEMIDAVRSIYKGEQHFCSSATEQKPKSSNDLTKREKAILIELLDGLNNKNIAKKLSISVRTVECHRGNIYRKLDTHSMSGLIRYAKKQGILF